MTGYGQANKHFGGKNYRIEIKSLNGKLTDIRFRTTLNLKDKELELRSLITEKGMRGKFEVNLVMESSSGAEEYFFNKDLMKLYYNELSKFAEDQQIDKGDIIQSIIRLPNIVQLTEGELPQDEWNAILEMSKEALDNLNNFRYEEGKMLESDILEKSNNISDLLEKIAPFETERIDNLRERIRKNLVQFLSKENVDENRFEQEIIFYLEKLDINEEKVRLAQHCKYFEEEVKKTNILKGKKLSFITQEMGREINTLGAKAQHSEIQQIVVQMKDDLEKVKEQVLNIL